MISNHKLTPTEEMILYILLIEEKEKGSYGLRYKIFQENLEVLILLFQKA